MPLFPKRVESVNLEDVNTTVIAAIVSLPVSQLLKIMISGHEAALAAYL